MLPPGTPVQVRCHSNCPWLGDFVVTELVHDAGGVLYRVRRRGHLRPMPAPLPESDVRPELAAVAAAG
jgi:hypothetical protein